MAASSEAPTEAGSAEAQRHSVAGNFCQRTVRRSGWCRLGKALGCLVLMMCVWSMCKPVRQRLQNRWDHHHAPWRVLWNSSLRKSTQKELLRRFCPVIHMDSREPVRPMRLKEYAKQCSLRFTKNGTLITPAQDFTLFQYRDRKGAGTYLDYEGPVGPPMDDVEDVPFYGRLDERMHRGEPVFALLYMFFWPWNAPYKPLPSLSIGAHMADLEHVRIIVDKRTLRIIQVYFGAHGHADGVWLNADQLNYDDSEHLRVLVYPGKGSHANYDRPGDHSRLMGLADDHNDHRGFFWNRKHRAVVPFPPSILHYGGRLSRHVVNAWQQAWWQRESLQEHGALPMSSWLALRTVFKGRRL